MCTLKLNNRFPRINMSSSSRRWFVFGWRMTLKLISTESQWVFVVLFVGGEEVCFADRLHGVKNGNARAEQGCAAGQRTQCMCWSSLGMAIQTRLLPLRTLISDIISNFCTNIWWEYLTFIHEFLLKWMKMKGSLVCCVGWPFCIMIFLLFLLDGEVQ